MKIEIETTEEGYATILKALDLYTRLLCGQTKVVAELFIDNGMPIKDPAVNADLCHRIAENNFNDIDGHCSSISIGQSCINAKVAYGIYKEFRYKSGLEGDVSVYKFEPRKLSPVPFTATF